MQKNKLHLMAMTIGAIVSGGVFAQANMLTDQSMAQHKALAEQQAQEIRQAPTVVSPGVVSSGTAAEISRLNEQIAILKAQVQRSELLAKIAKQESETTLARKASDTNSVVVDAPPPVVRSIEGSNNRLNAVLAFSSGETAVATTGATLSGGWKVVSVKESSVVLKRPRNGELVTLNFGYAPATQTQGAGQFGNQMSPSGMNLPMPR